MCSIFQCFDKDPKRTKDSVEATISFSWSIELKNITVRLVHAGGREELYRYAVPASQVLQRYPGMCIARPEVFKSPSGAILSPEDELSPGHKYYLIPSTTVRKLKRKGSEKKKARLPRIKESSLESEQVTDASEDFSDESVNSAKDFYSSKCSVKKLEIEKEKKPFVPPIQRPRLWKDEWEPSLTSIEEISP